LPTSLGLDFLNSVATKNTVDTPIDCSTAAMAFLEWLAQAMRVQRKCNGWVDCAAAMAGELDKVADLARALRE
jgi:hypothetical protein